MYHQKSLLGALPNFAHPLTPNVAAWIMNEGSGNKIYDIIGGNHGAFGAGAAAPSWVPGRNGPALDFDGANDYVDCGTPGSLSIAGNITVEIEIYPKVLGDYDRIISKGSGGDGSYIISLGTGVATRDLIIRYQYSGATYDANIPSAIYANTWYRVAFTFDGTIVRVYINGIEYTGGSGSGYSFGSQSRLTIGCRNDPSNYFDGIINEVKISNRKRDISEIQQLYIAPYCWFAQPFQAELMYAAPPAGLSIPVAMHHYEALRVC